MATRVLLYVGNSSHKCLLSPTQLCRADVNALNFSKHIKGFGRSKKIQLKNVQSNRGFKESVHPFLRSRLESEPISLSKLWKPFGFTIAFSGCTLLGAVIMEYERIRQQTYSILNQFKQYRIIKTGWRGDMERWWTSLSVGQKIFVPICFANILVFLGWKIPSLHTHMLKYFCTNPGSKSLCWPMLLSTFSHYSILHLAANMYVLHTFIDVAVLSLGREQFMALYLCTGIISSFTSQFYKTMLGKGAFSLGASGAIMGVLGYVCTQYPDLQLNVIFLPMLAFKASIVIKGLIAMDFLGCLFRLKFFDHAAHLGGALFGIFWQTWGNPNIWQKREPLLNLWHELRGPPRSH